MQREIYTKKIKRIEGKDKVKRRVDENRSRMVAINGMVRDSGIRELEVKNSDEEDEYNLSFIFFLCMRTKNGGKYCF